MPFFSKQTTSTPIPEISQELRMLKHHVNEVLQRENLCMEYQPPGCNYTLLKLTLSQKPPLGNKTIVLKLLKDQLGEGAGGQVLPAYQIHLPNYRMSAQPDFAVKISNPNEIIKPAEIAIMKMVKTMKVYYFGTIGTRQYCVMEYFAPHNLPCPLHINDIPTRLKYIVSLCSQLQLLHRKHYIRHSDLKIANTLILPTDLWLIDFGLAECLPDYETFTAPMFKLSIDRSPTDPRRHRQHKIWIKNNFFYFKHMDKDLEADDLYDNLLSKFPLNGQQIPGYHAPELEANLLGLKSDIYMLCGVLAELLGELNSCANRNGYDSPEFLHYGYDLRIALLGTIMGIDLRKLTIKFLHHMQNQTHSNRPAIEFVLRFFTTLYRLYVHNKQMTLAQQQEALVTLIILADCKPELYRKKSILLELLKPVTTFSGGPVISTKRVHGGAEYVNYAPDIMLYQGIIEDYRKKNQRSTFW